VTCVSRRCRSIRRAQYRIQRAAQFPAINANAGFASTRLNNDLRAPGQDAVINSWTAGVGFNAFELDVFGRVRSLKHEALEQYLAIEEVRRSAQISLVAEVASAYLTWQADQELLRLSKETLKVQQDAALMISRSKSAGHGGDRHASRADPGADRAGGCGAVHATGGAGRECAGVVDRRPATGGSAAPAAVRE
jgi:hypothetical protein